MCFCFRSGPCSITPGPDSAWRLDSPGGFLFSNWIRSYTIKVAKGESDSKELTNLVSINSCCSFIQCVTFVVSRWMSSDNVFVCSVQLSLPGVDKIVIQMPIKNGLLSAHVKLKRKYLYLNIYFKSQRHCVYRILGHEYIIRKAI